ncbi:MAG: hypothetical protein ABIG44_03540 [Planctomycetota bacterium]
MVTTDTIEGVVDSVLWYHFDRANDVLYIRIAAQRDCPTYAEETDDGFLMLRRQDNDETVGLTVVNWWRRFGSGSIPDSISELERSIEPWARKLAA